MDATSHLPQQIVERRADRRDGAALCLERHVHEVETEQGMVPKELECRLRLGEVDEARWVRKPSLESVGVLLQLDRPVGRGVCGTQCSNSLSDARPHDPELTEGIGGGSLLPVLLSKPEIVFNLLPQAMLLDAS